jgi:16S rRNA processing protein RimM
LSNEENIPKELVIIGRITRPREVRGEVWVLPMTDIADRFLQLKTIFLISPRKTVRKKISSARYINGAPVIHLEGIATREEAAKLTDYELAIPKDEVAKLPENRFYQFDLIGCAVYDGETELGKVTNVEQYPANDVLSIEATDGTGYSLALVESFVKKIDMEQKRIEIDASGLVSNTV